MLLADSERSALWYRLWMSGRYLKHDVSIVEPGERGDPVTLQISLEDYAEVTPLAKPLSQPEQILLRCREYLLTAPDRGEDWICRTAMGCYIARPDGSILLHVTKHKKGDPCLGPELVDVEWPEFLIAMTPERLVYANSAATRKLELTMEGTYPTGSVSLVAHPEDAKGDHFAFCLGFGCKQNESGSERGPQIPIAIVPVAMLGQIHDQQSIIRVEDEFLTIRSKDNSQTIDARIEIKTGKPQKLRFGQTGDSKSWIEISTEPNAFLREMTTADDSMAHQITRDSNAYDPWRPLSSICEFLLDDPLITELCNCYAANQVEKLTSLNTRHAPCCRARFARTVRSRSMCIQE